jgi:hypothetical protein
MISYDLADQYFMDLIKEAPKKLIGAFEFRGGIGKQEQCSYERSNILENLSIVFSENVHSSHQFWKKVQAMVAEANRHMGEERIKLPIDHSNLPKHDMVFEFQVSMYKRNWT